MSQQAETNGRLLLSPAIIEAIAQRVAELLRADLPAVQTLLTPSEVAERFAVSRTWVYEHAEDLGAIRLGGGPRARLRFDPERVRQALGRAPRPAAPRDGAHRPARWKKGLLPIGSE
jgi:hypothetical protein